MSPENKFGSSITEPCLSKKAVRKIAAMLHISYSEAFKKVILIQGQVGDNKAEVFRLLTSGSGRPSTHWSGKDGWEKIKRGGKYGSLKKTPHRGR